MGSQSLTDVRCRMIRPLFDHIKETVELERAEKHSNPSAQDAQIAVSAKKLATMLAELDEQDRQAILAVIRHETSVLLLACMTKAATLKIELDAGIP